MRRRLLIALLLVFSLAGGLWRNSTRLNETEQKLVGVWESGDPPATAAIILRRDHRKFSAVRVGKGDWVLEGKSPGRWHASSSSLTLRNRVTAPTGISFSKWMAYVKSFWNGKHQRIAEISRLTDDEFELHFPYSKPETYCHSISPDLLRLYYQLNAGESP